MGRIRSIKPEFFADEELSTITESAHILAAGLLCYADDEGYFNANTGLIKAAIFPLREPSSTIQGMLSELSNIGFIQLGETPDGKSWGRVVKFSIHQRVNRPTVSKIRSLPIIWENLMQTHAQLTEESLPEGKGREGKGGEKPPPRPEENYDPGAEPIENIPEGMAPMQYAGFVADYAGIPAGYGLQMKIGKAIEILAKEESATLAQATKQLALTMARASPQKWAFWLEDGKFKQREEADLSIEGME
jgi:hypothetical protein